MPAYLVRYADTKHFAGFYAADIKDDLFYLIDEETDPGDYEYALIESGFGIEFRKGRLERKVQDRQRRQGVGRRARQGGRRLHH